MSEDQRGAAGEAPGSGAAVATRHREHRFPGRRYPGQVRFDDEELAAIVAAAGQAGLTPSGYVGAVALAAARGTGPPAPSPSRLAAAVELAGRAVARVDAAAEVLLRQRR